MVKKTQNQKLGEQLLELKMMLAECQTYNKDPIKSKALNNKINTVDQTITFYKKQLEEVEK